MAAAAHTARIWASEYCLTAAYRTSSWFGGSVVMVYGPPFKKGETYQPA
jgi:hypothetical protein